MRIMRTGKNNKFLVISKKNLFVTSDLPCEDVRNKVMNSNGLLYGRTN